MSDAEATVRQSILTGISDCGYGQTMEKTVDNIIKRLFEKPVRWSIEEYLKEQQS